MLKYLNVILFIIVGMSSLLKKTLWSRNVFTVFLPTKIFIICEYINKINLFIYTLYNIL